MRIAVIGAGIAGLCTALELRLAGFDVVIVDRRTHVATEGSFGALGLSVPLPQPPWPSVLAPGIPFWRRWRPGASWLNDWKRASSAPRVARELVERMPGVRQGQARFDELRTRFAWTAEPLSGALWPLTTARQVRDADTLLPSLREAGADLVLLGADDARKLDPTLNEQAPMLSALYCASAQSVNVRQVAHHIKDTLARLGAEFQFGLDVSSAAETTAGIELTLAPPPPDPEFGLAPQGASATPSVRTLRADALVLCTGSSGGSLLRSLGVRPAPRTVWGWTLTAPLRAHEVGPRLALVDESTGITVARLGTRLRAAGGFVLSNPSDHEQAVAARLQQALDAWFPGQSVRRESRLWVGARATWPDGRPRVGPGPTGRVWLHLGLGSDGWAAAWSGAAAIARALAGEPQPPRAP